MKRKHKETLAHWLEAFRGAEQIPFEVNRRRLYRVPELYEGYDPKDADT
jgi:hypothetical protein